MFVLVLLLPARADDRYFPQAKTLREHGKYLLYSDGYERASMLGFRCVADRDLLS